MNRLYIFGLVLLTSWVAYRIGIRRAGVEGKSLRSAFVTVLECLGMFAIFFAINVSVGTAIILLVRFTTPRFIPVYVVGDVMLIILSMLQGFLFQLWWRK